MNYKKLLFLIVFVFLVSIFFDNQLVFANTQDSMGFEYSDELGLTNQEIDDPRDIIMSIVKFFLSFLGLIAVSMVMWAGFLWMTSGGDPAKVDNAKKTLINSMIGLAIVISSFMIVLFVEKLMTGGFGDGSGTGPMSSSGGSSGSGLPVYGNEVIASHYPESGQRNVVRNTMIAVTFKEVIDLSTMIDDVNGDGVFGNWNDAISDGGDGDGELDDGEYDKPLFASVNVALKDYISGGPYVFRNAFAQASSDGKTFTFTQVEQVESYIGDESDSLEYSVYLTDNIQKANGLPLWVGVDSGYIWSFETGTEIDTVPPQVRSIIPTPGVTEARNVVVQANFSEAINPMTMNSMSLSIAGTPINGLLFISNGYKTIEFLSDEDCGTNSCGQTVYCLPASSDIDVLIEASNLGAIIDGITDMAGNSLDGNKNGVAQGPLMSPYNENDPYPETQGDSYTWQFSTNLTINITSPSIVSINPQMSGRTSTRGIPSAMFSSQLMSSSVTTNNPPGSGSVALYAVPVSGVVNFWLSVDNDGSSNRGTVSIRHEEFSEDTRYIPEFNSGIKDVYQNCYHADGADGGGPSCIPNPPAEPYCCNGATSSVSCEPIFECGANGCERDEGECLADCDDCAASDCFDDGYCNEYIGEDEVNSPNDCSILPPGASPGAFPGASLPSAIPAPGS